MGAAARRNRDDTKLECTLTFVQHSQKRQLTAFPRVPVSESISPSSSPSARRARVLLQDSSQGLIPARCCASAHSLGLVIA